MDLHDGGRLINVFCAKARSIAAYESFRDIVIFVTRYLTNKYDMSFAPFGGAHHHGQPILFAYRLVSSEDVDTFIWLSESWLSFMSLDVL